MAYGRPIAWKSQKQPTVALSTTEAEYMATSDATRQAIWIKQLLQDLHLDTKINLLLYTMIMLAMLLTRNPGHHDRTKTHRCLPSFHKKASGTGSSNRSTCPFRSEYCRFFDGPAAQGVI